MRGDCPQVNQSFSQTDKKNQKKKKTSQTTLAAIEIPGPPMCVFSKWPCCNLYLICATTQPLLPHHHQAAVTTCNNNIKIVSKRKVTDCLDGF